MIHSIQNSETKRTELSRIIQMIQVEGAEKQNYENILKECKAFYLDNSSQDKAIRHFYSDIYGILKIILENDKSSVIGETISENLKSIIMYLECETDDRYKMLHPSLLKLWDHLNLEISRISERKRLIEQNLDLQDRLNQLNEEIDKEKKKVDKLKEETIRQHVSTLGIFASVVLAFSGGMSFIATGISSLRDVAFGKVILTILVTGEVLLGIFYGLFSFVLPDSLNERRIKKFKMIFILASILSFMVIIILLVLYFVLPEHQLWISQ